MQHQNSFNKVKIKERPDKIEGDKLKKLQEKS